MGENASRGLQHAPEIAAGDFGDRVHEGEQLKDLAVWTMAFDGRRALVPRAEQHLEELNSVGHAPGVETSGGQRSHGEVQECGEMGKRHGEWDVEVFDHEQ